MAASRFRDKDPNIGRVESRSFGDKNGTTPVSVSKYATPDGQKAAWTVRRHLQDQGRTLIVDRVLTLDGGRKLTAKRILRKQ